MKKFFFPAIIATLLFALACSPKNAPQASGTPVRPTEPSDWTNLEKPTPAASDTEEIAEYTYDDLVVTPGPEINKDSLMPYNPSNTFQFDLIHTKIDISFDWSKKRANGKATLTLRPWFYPNDQITLDAKNFDIRTIYYEGQSSPLKYDYNNEQLTVYLGKTFTRKDEFRLVVEYTAKPDERESYGGSLAITNDKGLYFINPDGAEMGKPKQIWTQGETESNSFWFPTVDKPNERCTQEMYITVEDKYTTLSNGVLAGQKKNNDGTRTDYWKMDKPHAPYLFMMAVGEYAVVKEKWRNIELAYYVEPKYEKDAKAIFNYTPEMLDFFSNKLNYTYPWPKFSQVVVRDYVSGAMENTTAVIFGEYVQLTQRELLDNHLTNEKVVAHEMFHHWFGDLVTTESWANLTLNEGFANYSEYLWLEHKYGADEADYHELQEQEGFMGSAGDGGHPLIHFGYENREDLFDAHSYNKGGAVLHMLRDYVGEDAFWASLNRYLTKNEYSDVEAHELRLAFEDVTGQDLNWFFDQWFFKSGYPMLDISYDWDEEAKETKVTIIQTQPAGKDGVRVFNLPLSVDIYDQNGKSARQEIRLTQRVQQFAFKSNTKPALVNVDAKKKTLSMRNDAHTPEEWAFMYRNAPLFRDRWDALAGLRGEESPLAKSVFKEALADKFWGIRQAALERADLKDPETLALIAKIAENEKEPSVKAAAITALAEANDKKYAPLAAKALDDKQQAYSVVGAALSALTKLDPSMATKAAKNLENEESDAIVVSLSELYAQFPDRAQMAWFNKNIQKIDNVSAFAVFENHAKWILALKSAADADDAIKTWKNISLNKDASQWRRFSATKSLAEVRNAMKTDGTVSKAAEIQRIIEEIKEKETDPTLKLYYDMF